MNKDFKKAKTMVFWDVEDFPNPTNGGSIDERIKSGLKKEGYEGEVFIKAYGEKKPENLNVVYGGVIDFITKSEKHPRLVKMLIDICLWSFDFLDDRKTEPRNLLFIAKRSMGVSIVEELAYLQCLQNFNVLVVVATGCRARETPLPGNGCTYWNWDSLLAGENALRSEEIAKLVAKFNRRDFSGDFAPPRKFLFSGDDYNSKPCVYCKSLFC